MKLFALTSVWFVVGPTIPPTPPIVVDVDYQYKNKFDYVYADPLKYDSSYKTRIKVKVSFESELHTSAYVRIRLVNDNYPSGVLLKKETLKGVKKYTFEYNYTQTYSTPFDKNSRFVFNLYSEYGDDYLEIYPKYFEPVSWNVTTSDQTFTSAKNLTLFKKSGSVAYLTEKVQVKNCIQHNHLLDNPYFDINHFEFYYSNSNAIPFKCDSLRLVITTHNGVFSDLGTPLSIANRRQIDLKFTKKNDTQYTFSTVNNMFVNPSTLEMSNTKKNGYVKTNYIYFPITCKAGESFEFRFIFDKLGANESKFFYDSIVYTSKRMFGNCFDSVYCVTTEEAEPAIDLGTRIEH